jgi:crotonobetainyl-CoA:carnitine CoA-transferase CaiB-like acyl-CoA transferase
MTQLPLHGVRVLDFTRVLAGPFATAYLADLGADVIKIENPSGGDETRHWGPPWAGDGEDRQSAYYLSVNRNKRSLTLNLRTPEGVSLARELAATSHILVENMKVGGMAKFGLGYDDLSALNPALVYASITGYGLTGPYATRPGYDFAIQAMSGLMSITGTPEGEPMKVGVAITDVIAGLYTATSVLAALRHAEATGVGQHIDTALLDTSFAAMVNIASNYLVSGQAPARYGNGHPNIVPYQVFDASDRGFALACGNDGQFAALCRLIDREAWIVDPRFATNPARVENRETLIPLLAGIFEIRTADDWVAALLAVGVPAGPINDLPTIANDPQLAARRLVQSVTLTNGEQVPLVRNPVQFSETPPELRIPPPALGQHTDEILRDLLGKTEPEIEGYRERNVV